ncbi:uncharacterized protein LOC122260880 [Penaeus japonicus]|uniref:uncharacterized protein LOC122260880 n=1 Tax=Penaeus japonicus TaxID=27405 RepID=UPI001C716688|nr:uncharacterized protein LOC122260880 [Penaeus japonicus]XP_042884265.1 uncharacterized protein LOC122260880 [Penaeus japonicus]
MNDNKNTENAMNLQNNAKNDHQFGYSQYGHNSGDWQYGSTSFSTNVIDSSADGHLHSGNSQIDGSYLAQQSNTPYRSVQHRDSTPRGGPNRDISHGNGPLRGSTSRDNSMRGGPSRNPPYSTNPSRHNPNMSNPSRDKINAYRAYDRASEREIPHPHSVVVGGIPSQNMGNLRERHDSTPGDHGYNGDLNQVMKYLATNYGQVVLPPPPCPKPPLSASDSGNQEITRFLIEKLGEHTVNSSAEAQQALKMINLLLKPIQEYNIKQQDAKAIALVSVAEMNIQTLMERDVFS